MRYAILAILLLARTAPAAVNWEGGCHQGYYFGIDRAKRESKPVFIFFTQDNCRYCEQLKQGALNDSVVQDLLNTQTVPVQINSSKESDYAAYHKITSYPTLAFWDVQHDEQWTLQTQDARVLEAWLRSQLSAYKAKAASPSGQAYAQPVAWVPDNAVASAGQPKIGEDPGYRDTHEDLLRQGVQMPKAGVPYPELNTVALNEVILKRLNSIDDNVKATRADLGVMQERMGQIEAKSMLHDARLDTLEKQMRQVNPPAQKTYGTTYANDYYTTPATTCTSQGCTTQSYGLYSVPVYAANPNCTCANCTCANCTCAPSASYLTYSMPAYGTTCATCSTPAYAACYATPAYTVPAYSTPLYSYRRYRYYYPATTRRGVTYVSAW
jgi:hypothetical protein